MTCKNFLVFVSFASLSFAQVTLNQSPARVVGQPQVPLTNFNPNLVEGRELFSPQSVVVDTNASPPVLYVADTGNNRVLAWRNASQFSNGQPADLIVGQRDQYSTLPLGGNQLLSSGLYGPSGLAVQGGNLYVVDTGNNRILRFPTPFAPNSSCQMGVQACQPDLVIGQADFTHYGVNRGQQSAGPPGPNTLNFAPVSSSDRSGAGITFDAAGNLWVVDSGNRRVLRFPAASLTAGNTPSADMVLGQFDFTSQSSTLNGYTTNGNVVKNQFARPYAVAFDFGGRLYVSDFDPAYPNRLSRVLVFVPPLGNGISAVRVLGVPTAGQSADVVNHTAMLTPGGIFMIAGNPAVVDPGLNRIIVFDSYDQWPAESQTAISPQARQLIGQTDWSVFKSNAGNPEASATTLTSPVAATTAANEVFIADAGNNRVIVMPVQSGNIVGAATRVLGQGGVGSDDFRYKSPNLIEGREFQFVQAVSGGVVLDAGMVVDQNATPPHLYVADPGNNRVLGFNDVRKVKQGDKADIVIGQPDMYRAVCNYNPLSPSTSDPNKPMPSGLCHPTDVAVDAGGNLWVADNGNSRVLRFPQPFATLGQMPAADIVLGQSSLTSKITDPSASTMGGPYGLAFAQANGLLVSDVVHNRVLLFPQLNGTFTSGEPASKVFGQPDFTTVAPGTDDNRMNAPHHISADSDGRPYVADTGNNRVMVFGQVAVQGAADMHAAFIIPGLHSPEGVFVSQQTGEIWVADTYPNNTRSASYRFPRFDLLALNSQPTFSIPSASSPYPLALTQDQWGNLYVADSANRIANYYPGLAAGNAANFPVVNRRALAPGMDTTIYPLGNQLGADTDSASTVPWPTQLADVQVLVGWKGHDPQPAPLSYAGPTQINFQVPWLAPSSNTADLQVVRLSTGQILASGSVAMTPSSPGLFMNPGAGQAGQLAALNQDNTVNGPSNPAARGSVIQLFGTGCQVANPPADGDGPQGLVSTSGTLQVYLGGSAVDSSNILFSGLAPGLPGVWQINVKIPDNVAPSPQTSVIVMYNSQPSTGDNSTGKVITTIAVKQ